MSLYYKRQWRNSKKEALLESERRVVASTFLIRVRFQGWEDFGNYSLAKGFCNKYPHNTYLVKTKKYIYKHKNIYIRYIYLYVFE